MTATYFTPLTTIFMLTPEAKPGFKINGKRVFQQIIDPQINGQYFIEVPALTAAHYVDYDVKQWEEKMGQSFRN